MQTANGGYCIYIRYIYIIYCMYALLSQETLHIYVKTQDFTAITEVL